MKRLFLLLGAMVGVINGHSWIHCTDYRMNEANNAEADTYDNSKCFGFPRHFKDFDRGFGVDAGYNYQISADGDNTAPCRTAFGDGTPYTTQYPMASYTPGQRVCLTWPTKNHVAAACNNQFIPDGGVKIYRSEKNPTGEKTKSQLQQNLVKDIGATPTPQNNNEFYTRIGYQRCPKFCDNNDKAMCSQCFTLPADLEAGTYTFAWFWIFNTGQLYTSCWEAKVGTGGGGGGGGTAAPPGSGPTSKPTDAPLAQDELAYVKVPSVITVQPFEIQVEVNAGVGRKVVVDILSVPDYKFYGKGVADAPEGNSIVKLTVTPENSPATYQNFILKGWVVKATDYDADPSTAYLFELSRIETPVTVGDKVVYSNASSGSSGNGGAIAGAFFGGFILCGLIVGGVLAYLKYGKGGKI